VIVQNRYRDSQKEFKEMSSIVHFETPADDLQRAKTFYIDLFGWKFEGVQDMDYMMVDTYGLSGGMIKRMQPDQQIFVQIGVPSVDEYSAKVEKLGGKILVPKKAIPGMGYFAICMDIENNVFGIVETDHTVPGKLLVSGEK
jgi:predicted enzyme related to lactoylglutathione lyase